MNKDNNENSNDNSIYSQDNTALRIRSQSECSVTSDDGTSETGKRQRTTSQQYMVASGLTAASPPKFVSLEEIMKAANGIRDMALVHHIAVDKDFKLERAQPPPNSVHKAVKETMHRAFWDLLTMELAEDPPNYSQAFKLLENIKEGLFSVLLPQHTKLKQQIAEVLDSELIRQQAQNGALDFQNYAQYVISVMAKLCAPVRDEQIKSLTETTDVIETFKGILTTLDVMALDMANFTIEMVKPDIIAHSVELERKKFADFLAVQNDGLEHTRNWLLKYVNADEETPPNVDRIAHARNLAKRAFTVACLDLLEWDGKGPYPETFMLDEARLSNLELQTKRLIIIGTVLLVTGSYAGPDLQSIASFKETVKNHASILIQSIKSERDLQTVLPNVAEQVVNDIKETKKAHGFSELSEDSEKLLKEQIADIANPEHRVRQLVRQRLKEFLLQIIDSATAAPQKVPSGLTALQKELAGVAGQFLRIVSHNSTVFSIYYTDIVSGLLPNPA